MQKHTTVKVGLVMVKFRRRIMTADKWIALNGWAWNKTRIETNKEEQP